MRSYWLVLVFLLALLAPNVSLNSMGGRSDPFPPPDIRIEMDWTEVHSKVEPSMDGIVVFTGTCYCDIPDSVSDLYWVSFKISADAGGWPVSIPPALYFSKYQSYHEFTISIQVPIQTVASDKNIVRIGGIWEYEPSAGTGTVDPVKVNIIVDQFSSISLGTRDMIGKIPVGSWNNITLIASNFGNGEDLIHLEAESAWKNIELEIERDIIDVEFESEASVGLKIKQTEGASDDILVTIRAWSDVAGSNNLTEMDLIIVTSFSLQSLVTTPSYYIPVGAVILIVMIITTWAVVRERYFNVDRMRNQSAASGNDDEMDAPKTLRRAKTPPKGFNMHISNRR